MVEIRTFEGPSGFGGLAAAVLALTFTAAAVTKLARGAAWRRTLAAYRLPAGASRLVAFGVPIVELVIVGLVVVGLGSTAGIVSLVALVLFSAAIVVGRVRSGRRLECGCFGGSTTRDYRVLLARNLALAGIALVAWRTGQDAPLVRSLREPGGADLLPAALDRARPRARRVGGGDGVRRRRPEVRPLRRRALGLGALVAVTVVALALPALAHHTDQVDPNDTDGKLDLEQVGFDHEGEAPSWRMVTFSTWTVRSIWDRGDFIVQLDTKGDAAADYVAVVRSDGRRLSPRCSASGGSGRQIEVTSLRTDKEDSWAATVTVPLREVSIGPNRDLVLLVGALELHGRELRADVSRRCSRTTG